jgi:hypothetical protein
MRSYHPPDDAHMLAILEPADVRFISNAICIPETSSGQAAPLMAIASPALSVMAVMRLLLTPWASPRLGLANWQTSRRRDHLGNDCKRGDGDCLR